MPQTPCGLKDSAGVVRFASGIERYCYRPPSSSCSSSMVKFTFRQAPKPKHKHKHPEFRACTRVRNATFIGKKHTRLVSNGPKFICRAAQIRTSSFGCSWKNIKPLASPLSKPITNYKLPISIYIYLFYKPISRDKHAVD
jgi:hypothetical protein